MNIRRGSLPAILWVLVGMFALTACEVTAGDLMQKIKQSGKLVVAQVGGEQPPFFWKKEQDGKTEWVGFEMDLAKQIADRLGVTLEILRLGDNYNEVCEVVNEGRADIGISNLSDTEARRKLVDFTNPYIVNRVAMFIDLQGLEDDNIDVIGPADLNHPDVRVSVPRNSIYKFVYDELMPKASLMTTPQGDFEEIARPVLSGEAHLVIDGGIAFFLGMSNNPGYAKRYFVHTFEEYDDPLSICLPHGQPEMLEFLNMIIEETEAEEPVTLDLIVDKYMK